MNIYFPTVSSLARGVVLAAVLAFIGHIAYPALGLGNTTSNTIFTAGLAVGALLMVLLSSIFTEAKIRITTLYVGNIAFKTSESALRELFSKYGQVQSVRIMKDRLTRKPRGFAFVEMERSAAKAAIKELDGQEFFGRTLKVNTANRPKSDND
ncbi:MAG: RNA-binding protein [Gammaproteobacteria bacterium]|nr:RNA-binding protein [Gammaproteobacteria bacterium]